MAKTAHGVEYGPLASAKSGPRGSKGRRCEQPECMTVLSVYNESPTCWVHSPTTMKRQLVRD